MKYLRQNWKYRMHILVYSTRWTRRPHAENLLSATLLAEIWKILSLDPSLLCANFTAAVPSTINNIKALRITFNSCKTASTYSMALATVYIDETVKVTSASSYVLPVLLAIYAHLPICSLTQKTAPQIFGSARPFGPIASQASIIAAAEYRVVCPIPRYRIKRASEMLSVRIFHLSLRDLLIVHVSSAGCTKRKKYCIPYLTYKVMHDSESSDWPAHRRWQESCGKADWHSVRSQCRVWVPWTTPLAPSSTIRPSFCAEVDFAFELHHRNQQR